MWGQLSNSRGKPGLSLVGNKVTVDPGTVWLSLPRQSDNGQFVCAVWVCVCGSLAILRLSVPCLFVLLLCASICACVCPCEQVQHRFLSFTDLKSSVNAGSTGTEKETQEKRNTEEIFRNYKSWMTCACWILSLILLNSRLMWLIMASTNTAEIPLTPINSEKRLHFMKNLHQKIDGCDIWTPAFIYCS